MAWSIVGNIKGQAGSPGATGPRGLATRQLAAGSFYWAANSNPVLSNGTDTSCNAIEGRFLPAGGGDLQIVFSNKNGTGPITLKVSMQWPANLTPAPVTWGGAATVTIPSGSTATSDAINGSGNIYACPSPGQEVFFRYYLTCSSGTQFEFVTDSGGGQVSGTTQTDQTGNYTFNYGSGGSMQIGMQALIGTPLLSGIPAVVGVGDSIMRGEGDALFGGGYGDGGPLYWAVGGFAATANPWANCAIVGEEASQFVTGATTRRQAYIKYADIAVVMYGTNDIGYSSGSISLASLQALLLKTWWTCNGYGAQVIGCTLLPRAASSLDNYETVSGQTVYTGWGTGSVAALFNAWVRGGAPILNGVAVAVGTSGALVAGNAGHPLAAVCNWTAPIEAGQDSGKWIVNGTANYATPDGTHPSDAMAQLMGAVLKGVIAAL